MRVTVIQPARRREPEHVEQRALFQWADLYTVRLPILTYLYAVPNGRNRGKAEAGKLKAEGVKRGVPDVALDAARGGFHGWRCEMKAPGELRSTSDDQDVWILHLRREGYAVCVCDHWQEAWNHLVHYLDRKDLAVRMTPR